MVDSKRTARSAEKSAEFYGSYRFIAVIETSRTLDKFVNLQSCVLRQRTAQCRHLSVMLHECDFRQSQLLALSEIFFRFIRKVRLPVRLQLTGPIAAETRFVRINRIPSSMMRCATYRRFVV
jgi:hypothetical protein